MRLKVPTSVYSEFVYLSSTMEDRGKAKGALCRVVQIARSLWASGKSGSQGPGQVISKFLPAPKTNRSTWNFLVVRLRYKPPITPSRRPLESAIPLSPRSEPAPPGPITANRSSLRTKAGNSAGKEGRAEECLSANQNPRGSSDQWQSFERLSSCVTAPKTNGHVARGL